MEYRRSRTEGASYFFTVVTDGRKKLFSSRKSVDLLNNAFQYVLARHPFIIEAIVVLPDHIHCVWSLPEGDSDFPTRWRLVKSHFTRHLGIEERHTSTPSRVAKGERSVWQRRYWEHCIRDEKDLERHIDYIHYNPVKHGLAKAPGDWPHSTFQKLVREGRYDPDWGSEKRPEFPDNVGSE